MSRFALYINTPASFKTQLRPVFWMKPFLVLASRAGHPSAVDHCALLIRLPLSLSPSWSTWPQGPCTTWAHWRGNAQERAPWEMNECFSHYTSLLSTFPMSLTQSQTNQRAKPCVKDFGKHMNRKREGENRPVIIKENRGQVRKRGEQLPSCISLLGNNKESPDSTIGF